MHNVIAWWNCCIICSSGGHTKIANLTIFALSFKEYFNFAWHFIFLNTDFKNGNETRVKRTENFATSILLKMTLSMSILTFLCTFSWYVLLYFAQCFVFLWNLIFTRMHIVALIAKGIGPKDYYVMLHWIWPFLG